MKLVGDILAASGVIAYVGAFTMVYRTKIVDEWVSELKNNKIPSS